MNRVNNGYAVLVTIVLLSIGIGSVGCDERIDQMGAAVTSDRVPAAAPEFNAKAFQRGWWWYIPPPRR